MLYQTVHQTVCAIIYFSTFNWFKLETFIETIQAIDSNICANINENALSNRLSNYLQKYVLLSID